MSGKGFGKQHQPKSNSKDLLAFPPEVNQRDFMSYISQNWDTIAALAYDSFLTSGKGVVIADWDNSLSRLLPWIKEELDKIATPEADTELRQQTFALIWMPRDSDLFREGSGVMFDGKKWGELIDRYDPVTSLILAVGYGATHDRSPCWMVRTLAVPGAYPKNIFEKNRARLSEFS